MLDYSTNTAETTVTIDDNSGNTNGDLGTMMKSNNKKIARRGRHINITHQTLAAFKTQRRARSLPRNPKKLPHLQRPPIQQKRPIFPSRVPQSSSLSADATPVAPQPSCNNSKSTSAIAVPT